MSLKKGVIISIFIVAGLISAAIIINLLGGSKEKGNDEGEEPAYPSISAMGVPFEYSDNITKWNHGYSDSTDCPWGDIHNGMDFFFENHSNVLAMVSGKVKEISVAEYVAPNKYMITLAIEYNPRMAVNYVFEPWTEDPNERDLQISNFKVDEGDTVEIGDIIAEFIAFSGDAHIHLSVYDNDEAQCPRQLFNEDAYQYMMDLIHTYEPTWEMCYD